VLSEDFSKTLIEDVHNNYCHIERTQMINKIAPFYTAKNIISNIKNTCDNCEICIKNKSRKKSKYGLMSHLGPAHIRSKLYPLIPLEVLEEFAQQKNTYIF